MKKNILLLTLLLLTCYSFAFSQTSQVRKYKVKYFKIYKEGELTSSSPEANEEFVFDENAKRIELKTGEGYQNRIFKIERKGPDPVHDQCTIYMTQMPTTNGKGLACVIIVVDRFYKLIRVGGCANNPDGLRNYMEYQYE